jgi:transposase
MRFLPIKTDDRLDLQAIHRVRDRLIARHTAVINQLRAFLLERDMVFAKTPAKLRIAMPEFLENAENDLTPWMRNLLKLLGDEWKMVEQQIGVLSHELERIADADAGCSHTADSRDRAGCSHGHCRGHRQRSRLPQWP